MTKEQMERIAIHVITNPTFAEAARKSGISESGLRKLRKRKVFQKILNETKNKVFDEALLKAQGYTLEAVEVLKTIMDNKKTNATARVSAARAIYEMGLNAYTIDEIKTIQEDLEQKYGE